MPEDNQDMNQYDKAAVDAQNDFVDMIDHEALELSKVVEWWEKWYLKAGHKRLGRILIGKF